jgi:hypothetical protein
MGSNKAPFTPSNNGDSLRLMIPDGNPVGVRQTIEVAFHPYPKP